MVEQRRSVLLGLIGRGIGASKSPLLHETEARAHQLQLVYRLIDFAQLHLDSVDLKKILDNADSFGFDGFNVTHPYKTAVIPFMDELSREAESLGSVNTVLVRDGRRIGHNTDWSGFAQSIRLGLPSADKSCVTQLGAGGAGAATAYAMLTLGAEEVRLYDVDAERTEVLATKLAKLFPERNVMACTNIAQAMHGTRGVVQSTPVGMNGHPGIPISPDLLTGDMWVADIIYTPLETELLAAAHKRGCAAINGMGMVVSQAVDAFKLFTNIEPDPQRMMNSFLAST